LGLRAGRGGAAVAWIPGPADQRVLADMVDQVFGLAAAIARGIPELNADLGQRLAFPGHFTRREMPFMMARHPVGIEIARSARVANQAFSPNKIYSCLKMFRFTTSIAEGEGMLLWGFDFADPYGYYRE
jgi:hypothetical protein